jgi:hypothetical protein
MANRLSSPGNCSEDTRRERRGGVQKVQVGKECLFAIPLGIVLWIFERHSSRGERTARQGGVQVA